MQSSKELDFDIGIERQWVSNGIRYCIYTAGITLIGVNIAVWSLVPFLYSNPKNPTHRIIINCGVVFQILSGGVLLAGGIVAGHDEPLARMERQRRRKLFAHRQAVQEQKDKVTQEEVLIAAAAQNSQLQLQAQHHHQLPATAAPITIAPAPSLPAKQSEIQPEEENSRGIVDNVLRVLSLYGIQAQCLDLIVGPSTMALYLLPTGSENSVATVAKVANCAAELQTFLGLQNKPLIGPSARGIQIELPREDRQLIPLEAILPVLPPDPKGKMSMLMGVDINFDPVLGELDEPYSAHWLVAGESGSGKTVTLQSAALSLILRHPPTEVQLVIIDLKEETFPQRLWGNIPWLWREPAYEAESALELIEALNDEMENRKAIFRNNGVSNFVEYCQLEDVASMPRLVLFSDETSDLSSKTSVYKQQFDQLAEPAAQKWRSFGINWVLALQRCTEDKLSRGVVSNLQARVCLKVIDGANSKAAVGITGGEDLLGKGDMLVKIAGDLKRTQSCFAAPAEHLSKYQNINNNDDTKHQQQSYFFPEDSAERARVISQLADKELGGEIHHSTTPPNHIHQLHPLSSKGSTTPPEVTTEWVFPDPYAEIAPPVRKLVEELFIAGVSQTQTIKQVWGITKSGTYPRYGAALAQYQKIVREIKKDERGGNIDWTLSQI